jgi:hypothetical protein
MANKKNINKETVQKQIIKKKIKNETVYALDENRNLIIKDMPTIQKELNVENVVEFKVSEKSNNKEMIENIKNLDDSINDVINDGVVEIQAEVMEDEEDVKKVKKIKTSKSKKQEIEQQPKEEITTEIKPETNLIINKIDKNKPLFTEQYKYNDNTVNIIKDKPSTPLVLENYNSNKKQYESYLGKNFIIYYNGVELYDSSKSNAVITFEDDYFLLFSKKYSYMGFRIKLK